MMDSRGADKRQIWFYTYLRGQSSEARIEIKM